VRWHELGSGQHCGRIAQCSPLPSTNRIAQCSTLHSIITTANRQLCADDPREPRLLRRRRKPHRAAEVVVVGERQRRHSQFHRAFHETLRIGRAVEQ
jgi:hypothetical protein